MKEHQKLGQGLAKTASESHKSQGANCPWGCLGLALVKGKSPYPQFLLGPSHLKGPQKQARIASLTEEGRH